MSFPSFFQVGMGTERLEENIQMLFPNANIVRMDADSTKRKMPMPSF